MHKEQLTTLQVLMPGLLQSIMAMKALYVTCNGFCKCKTAALLKVLNDRHWIICLQAQHMRDVAQLRAEVELLTQQVRSLHERVAGPQCMAT